MVRKSVHLHRDAFSVSLPATLHRPPAFVRCRHGPRRVLHAPLRVKPQDVAVSREHTCDRERLVPEGWGTGRATIEKVVT